MPEIRVFYKNALMVGLGLSGRSAAHFLLKRGVNVSAIDKNRDTIKEIDEVKKLIQSGLKLYSENHLPDIHAYDLIVVSPGIPPLHPIYKAALNAKKEVVGEIELACRFLTQPCLGITGSNGKTTTALWIEHILNQSGKPAKAVGNIGKPLIQVLDECEEEHKKSILVIELSSWQLETMQSQSLDAAAVINITPNHLDRHGTMEAYARAKLKIKHCLKPGKQLFMGYEAYQNFGYCLTDKNTFTFGYHPECKIYCDKERVLIDQKTQFYLPEEYRHNISHDAENLMAAYALCCEMEISSKDFSKAFVSFKKPPHRIEFVRKFKEISYYDDSKATSIDAVLKAVNFLEGKVILIAGGVHKGFSYSSWIQGFGQKVRCLCAIGEAAEQLKQELSFHINVVVCLNLEDAVQYASKLAKPGENVLLSPGCASFDMFKDYKQRGEVFKQIVNRL